MSHVTKQSYWWYVPTLLILSAAYAIGGGLVFGLHFLGWVPSLDDERARLSLELFGMGMLGAALYSTKWWARDMQRALREPQHLPHALDCFGYATTVVGGGITGIIFYLAVRAGSILTFADSAREDGRLSFALFVSFCGGLFHFKVLGWFEEAVRKMLEAHGDRSE